MAASPLQELSAVVAALATRTAKAGLSSSIRRGEQFGLEAGHGHPRVTGKGRPPADDGVYGVRERMTARRMRKERIDPVDSAEPTLRTDAAEPIEPIDKTDPTDATEKAESREAIERNEFSDHSDHLDVVLFMNRDSKAPASSLSRCFGCLPAWPLPPTPIPKRLLGLASESAAKSRPAHRACVAQSDLPSAAAEQCDLVPGARDGGDLDLVAADHEVHVDRAAVEPL